MQLLMGGNIYPFSPQDRLNRLLYTRYQYIIVKSYIPCDMGPQIVATPYNIPWKMTGRFINFNGHERYLLIFDKNLP